MHASPLTARPGRHAPSHRRAAAQVPRRDDDASPRWLRALTVLLAGASAGTASAMSTWAPAPGPGPQSRSWGAPQGAGAPARMVPDADVYRADVAKLTACWDPQVEPSLERFLGRSAPEGVAWRRPQRPLWGHDGEVLRGDGALKALEARALDASEAPRAAALGSLLAQAPWHLTSFMSPVADTVVFNLTAAVSDPIGPQGDPRLVLLLRDTLPACANGSLVAYGDRRGTWQAMMRKLDLKLEACATPIRLHTVSEVFRRILGKSGSTVFPNGLMTLSQAFVASESSPAFPRLGPAVGAARFTGRAAFDTVQVDLSRPDGAVRLDDYLGEVNLTLAVGLPYGLLSVHAAAPARFVELFNPLGQQGVATGFRGGRETLVLQIPLGPADALQTDAVIVSTGSL